MTFLKAFVVIGFVVMAFVLLSSGNPADSQGVPCTISNARQADGTLECEK